MTPRSASSSVAGDHVGPFHTNGELGGLFAAGIGICIAALVLAIGVITYPALYTVDCQSEKGVGLMIGSLFAGAAGCIFAGTFKKPAASVAAASVGMIVAFVAGQWLVHIAFLSSCPPHPHWFQ
jgi:hypothetical protein